MAFTGPPPILAQVAAGLLALVLGGFLLWVSRAPDRRLRARRSLA